jgi:ferredoxin, 2Fe-2S
MGVIRVVDHSGNAHKLDAVEGWRVMEIIREHGLDIEAVCGGACACATCHVVVEPDWADRLHPAREDEESMLDSLPSVADTSRLSCQIIYQTALDGLALRLGKTG